VKLEMLANAARLTHRIGIATHGFFIFGLPGETQQTIRQTIKFAKSLAFLRLSSFSGLVQSLRYTSLRG
jgi:radical SAM superfamily enzyme YgiQ (UPF0313 family)